MITKWGNGHFSGAKLIAHRLRQEEDNCMRDLAVIMLIQWPTILLLTGTTSYDVSLDILQYIVQATLVYFSQSYLT